MSDLLKFKIVTSKEDQSAGLEETVMLININHLVSIKPIRIMTKEKILQGFWIRTSNGKKYRATEAPQNILDLLGNDMPSIPSENPIEDTIGNIDLTN